MGEIEIGVIGGSGLYRMEGLTVAEERRLETPFGEPSDVYVLGELEGRSVAFLSRHGRGHRLLPSEINFRANVYGLKLLGVERIVSISAVGSMKHAYEPTHIVVPDQFFDRTRHRVDSFFGAGLVAHVSMADPVCAEMVEVAVEAGRAAGATVHRGGTYLCIEGPQFSTRAESHVYRSWGVDVIGMTNLQEARMAREAEICYATLAMITDYDCWHEEEPAAHTATILEVLRQNVATAQRVVAEMVRRLPARAPSHPCANALAGALVTDTALVPEATLRALGPIVGKYLS
ncbi:MAG TPA: S-methyl-5'-thioadenosine phosphorylase [Thermoanaerobaculia bacterium]|nr:S-methyl-5'-thioadenosine phosphorylase [Thermoanaerobaculia bacterium]